MGGLSTAERNRRKRERKKQERIQQQQSVAVGVLSPGTATTAAGTRSSSNIVTQPHDPGHNDDDDNTDDFVEIEYVADVVHAPDDAAAIEISQRFQLRQQMVMAPTVISSDEQNDDDNDDEEDENGVRINTNGVENDGPTSKRKLREQLRPTVAELKRRVKRPDLVEAHDVAATDADFLIWLKGVSGSVPVPRHWGRKRKYLQGKRGYEKPPFRLPQFIIDTGIAELRDSVMANENEQTAKQKNRARVTPKLGAIDVDYRTLHDAFFKHQTKPTNLTKIGDVYYEGKELEVGLRNMRPGQPLSKGLLEALGMDHALTSPPPWLWNMQRLGPPPSWSGLSIPGLNAPLPDVSCQYGYHATGWGQPPVDAYGRPLYGGNPLDPPGSGNVHSVGDTLVTSQGKTIVKDRVWGALPTGASVGQHDDHEKEEEDDDDSSDGEMEQSSLEEEELVEDGKEVDDEATDGLPAAPDFMSPAAAAAAVLPVVELRKQGMETPKTLYKVLDATVAHTTGTEMFASQHQYKVGAESVLSKVAGGQASTAKTQNDKTKDDEDDDEEEEGIGKNFKF